MATQAHKGGLDIAVTVIVNIVYAMHYLIISYNLLLTLIFF